MAVQTSQRGSKQTGGSDNSSWTPGGEAPQGADQARIQSSGTVQGGLSALFGLSSMTSDNRNLKEVADVMKVVLEIYERVNTSTTNEIQRKIIPTIESLTSAISPLLPGLGFHCEIGGTLYVMAALFSNRNLTLSSERITVNSVGNMSQHVSIPVPPAAYANQQLVDNLTQHYTRYAESKGIKSVSVINMIVVDLEMLNHPEAGEPKDHPHIIATGLAAEWEEAIMVKAAQEFQAANGSTPCPFKDPNSPYGKDNCAEARVTAISSRTTKLRTLTAANMEVTVTTINNPNSSGNNFQANSREIARVTAIVGLNAVSWEDYQRHILSQRTPDQASLISNFMGMGMGNVYPSGYRPLRPVITIEDVQAGEMLNNNGGLVPYFYGLFALMTTNNQYVFAEAVRRHMVGSRGNLADLEVRINQMLAQFPGGMNINRIILDEKKISDTEIVNLWIRQNVSPHATFQVNLIPSGPHSSITNFLFQLANKATNAAQVKTVIGIVDSMTKNRLSKIIARNHEAKSGWTPDKPILLPTGMLVPNGLAEYAGKKLNTQELDEMMIAHIKGKNASAAIESFLGTQYGVNPNEDYKQRSQKLRIELNQSIFDGNVHINGFAQPHIWAPDFMSAFGEAMDSIGSLNVANTLGSFRTTNLVYAPGVGLATMVGAGNNNNSGAALGAGFNLSVPFA